MKLSLRTIAELTLLCLGLLLSYVIIREEYPQPHTPYQAMMASLSIFAILAPILSILAAWKVGRFTAIVRSTQSPGVLGKILLRELVLVAALTWIVAILALGIMGGFAAADAVWAVLLITLHCLFWLLLGAALALTLPINLAYLAAAFLPFVLQNYTATGENPRWRQMFGQGFALCCAPEQKISPIFFRSSATTLLLLSAVLCGLLLYSATPRFLQTKLSAAGTAVAVVSASALSVSVGYVFAQGGNYTLSAPRPSEQLTCSDGVCAWPETPAQIVAINRKAMASLRGNQPANTSNNTAGTATTMFPRIVDFTTNKPDEIQLVHSSDPQEVRNAQVIQLLARENRLQQAPSCWASEDTDAQAERTPGNAASSGANDNPNLTTDGTRGASDVLSVADTLSTVDEGQLYRLATDEHGRYRGFQQQLDTRAITSLVNQSCAGG